MHRLRTLFLLFGLAAIWLCQCATPPALVWDSNTNQTNREQATIKGIVDQLTTQPVADGQPSELSITYPYDGSIFPPDIAAPVFGWQDRHAESTHWLLTLSFGTRHLPIHALLDRPTWMPDKSLWETIKANSIESPMDIVVTGLSDIQSSRVTSRDRITISTSADPVGAAIFFRQVPLPFSTKNFDQMKWCLGDVSSYDRPTVVMENLPICASCHMFSADGKTFSMEMNYGNDGGAQFIKPVEKDIWLTGEDFISWNDYPRAGILPKSRGLFGKMSPGAGYIASSVNEISLALITNDLQFSQVFFPTYGIIAFYQAGKKQFSPLPGADDYDYVHANPNWSPDEKFVVFCRAKTKNEVHEDIAHVVPRIMDAGIHALNQKYNIQFDLYRIPFNHGQGGIPEPIIGASQNGWSNYFPRYSPDGKWIVYTRSQTGIMLQPDSQLFIIPSDGGVARKMTCNRSLFNSWHSWSPNGKWLLFSSKVNTPFTQIFLTHIDANGDDAPPVLLSRFSSDTHAANVPEFANIEPDAIEKIRVRGVHD